ncbi:MAG TPA: ABC transporter permease [Actinomycetota bacterium]|jgi:ABC-2 type transport system permease protein|nr:ABC transporter permease [Actinomycetota bacterium]
MSAAAVTVTDTPREHAGVGAVYRVEIAKIRAQLLPRVAAVICVVAPLGFVIFISTQSSVPADSLFGRWVQSSGFATPFIMLSFAGIAGFPLIASVVAGDIFASEDRLSTWKTVLTRSVSRGQIFVGKTLAAMTFSVAMVALLGFSSTIAGMLVVGRKPLVGLSGQLLSESQAIKLIVESYAIALVPTLAFTCLAILFSVTTKNSMAGVIGAPVVALLMVGLGLMGSGVVVRSMLLTSPFEAWHGLQITPSTSKALWIGLLVSFAYGTLSLVAAWRSFRRRDFAGDGQAPFRWSTVGRAVVATVVLAALLLAGTMLNKTWITSTHLEASVSQTLSNLIVVQQQILGRELDAADVKVYSYCKRESVISGVSSGPADDWTCQSFVDGPHVSRLAADYSISVRPDGCYTADAPASLVGPLHMKTPDGGTTINPLSAFDSCMIAP